MINWSSAILAGVVGGLAMELSAVLLRLLGFGRHSMVSYEGCMLTGRESGAGSYLAGLIMHLALSVLIALGYAWSFEAVWGGADWLRGLATAVPHWFAGGLVVPLFDRLSGCVTRGAVQPLKPFASGSRNAFVTFLIGHLSYGATVGALYS
ncbi:MAG: hypothetical protein ICV60_23600 [Pyrinomonadaceae bacterium]|nr:hypothetical protein [Pyrinomonadaceae bacterium]